MLQLRALGVVALVACGGARPASSPGAELSREQSTSQPSSDDAARPTAVEPSPSAAATPGMLTKRNELYMVVVDGKTAHCEEWVVEPDRNVMSSQLVVDHRVVADEISFRADGTKLELFGYMRIVSPDETTSTACSTELEVHDNSRGLLVGDAMWFRRDEACEAAVANHERVATDLDCRLEAETPVKTQRASRAIFEGMLARGGRLFSIVDGPKGRHCKQVRVSAARGGVRGVLEGDFEVAVVRDDGVKGTQALSYQYKLGADTITFLGPGRTWADGGAEAFG